MFGTRPSERATMARGLALLFGAGATLVLLTLALPHHSNTDVVAVAIPPIVAYGVVVAMLTVGERVPLWAFPLVPAGGAVLVSVCVLYGGDSGDAYSLMYVWVALYAGYFFSPQVAVTEVLWCGGLYAAALAARDDVGVPQAHWVMAVGTAAVAATLIAGLVRHLRAQTADLEAVAGMANGLVDPAAFGPEVCRQVQASTGADLVVLLAPADGGRLRTLGAAGRGGIDPLIDGLTRGVGEALRGQEPVTLTAPGRRVAGLAHPVVRDARTDAVLVVAWRRPRRRLPERAANAAAVFAGQAAVAMDRLDRLSRERERRALELHDNVVQGIAVARYALAVGAVEEAGRALDETLGRARAMVTDQLDDVLEVRGEIQPGDLVRGESGGLNVP
jgi:signal transduction histidine kinase